MLKRDLNHDDWTIGAIKGLKAVMDSDDDPLAKGGGSFAVGNGMTRQSAFKNPESPVARGNDAGRECAGDNAFRQNFMRSPVRPELRGSFDLEIIERITRNTWMHDGFAHGYAADNPVYGFTRMYQWHH